MRRLAFWIVVTALSPAAAGAAGTAGSAGAWWSGSAAGWIGGTLGSSIGLVGALVGILGGTGRARWFVLPLMRVMSVVGVFMLILGLVALVSGQPYGVWYPLSLGGFLSGLLFSVLYPVARNAYDQREQWKMEAKDRGS